MMITMELLLEYLVTFVSEITGVSPNSEFKCFQLKWVKVTTQWSIQLVLYD